MTEDRTRHRIISLTLSVLAPFAVPYYLDSVAPTDFDEGCWTDDQQTAICTALMCVLYLAFYFPALIAALYMTFGRLKSK